MRTFLGIGPNGLVWEQLTDEEIADAALREVAEYERRYGIGGLTLEDWRKRFGPLGRDVSDE